MRWLFAGLAVVIYFVGKRWKMRFDFENICVVIICAMVGVIIGGRLGYVLVYNGPFYAAHPLEVRTLRMVA